MDDLETRIESLERAVTDGEHDLSGLETAAAAGERLEEIETELSDLADTVDELEATTQALRGYVGNVRAVNREIERRAEVALAKAESLESSAGAPDMVEATSGRRGEASTIQPRDDERELRDERDTQSVDQRDVPPTSGRTNGSDERTVSPTNEETAPRLNEQTTPRTDDEDRPRTDGEVTPRTDDEDRPRTDGEVTPRTDDEDRPRTDGEVTPRTDGETRPSVDGNRTSEPPVTGRSAQGHNGPDHGETGHAPSADTATGPSRGTGRTETADSVGSNRSVETADSAGIDRCGACGSYVAEPGGIDGTTEEASPAASEDRTGDARTRHSHGQAGRDGETRPDESRAGTAVLEEALEPGTAERSGDGPLERLRRMF